MSDDILLSAKLTGTLAAALEEFLLETNDVAFEMHLKKSMQIKATRYPRKFVRILSAWGILRDRTEMSLPI